MRKRDVFVSYASEDAEQVARPLVEELEARGLTVWFAEQELVPGLSLRKQIDAGLAHSRLGAVVLSRHFFNKEWPQWELEGLHTRMMKGERGVIVPVWHKIGKGDVERYSAPLAGLFALQSRDGIDRVADGIELALTAKMGRRRGARRRRPQPPPRAQAPAIPMGRFGLGVAVVLALALALLVAAWILRGGGEDPAEAGTEPDAGRRPALSSRASDGAGGKATTGSETRRSPGFLGLEKLGAKPNGAPVSPKVEIETVKYFMPRIGQGAAGPDEYQLKIKPRIVNRSRRPVDVSVGPGSPLALAIPAKGSDRDWISSSQPPYRSWRGLLLIPPNPDGEIAMEYPAGRGQVSRSYATHWPFQALGPGKVAFEGSYRSGSAVVKRGDLVFSIPRGTYREGGPMALVYKTPGHQPYLGSGAFPGAWGSTQYPDFF